MKLFMGCEPEEIYDNIYELLEDCKESHRRFQGYLDKANKELFTAMWDERPYWAMPIKHDPGMMENYITYEFYRNSLNEWDARKIASAYMRAATTWNHGEITIDFPDAETLSDMLRRECNCSEESWAHTRWHV